ncbi:sensor histidine kinase [Desulfurispira natronophila]|uniref:histidine kinase n=1 Tax=Desulfurispira natronophila TaxID=682562 RepID=A0A7W7Y2H1_9BACT|nr:HAMP domain-containing sensor histidine kinase [Desulfurispira natronophila]MBB5020843.1 signal transduction histidine kinase [Desulfurispira natronophila]
MAPATQPTSDISLGHGTHHHRFYRRANIFVVGVLILLTLIYFVWQVQSSSRTFQEQVNHQSSLLAEMLLLNTRASLMTEEVLTDSAELFLSNMAEFIVYLDAVEPFSAAELTAFSQEAGLAGIRIEHGEAVVEGPPGWWPEQHRMQHSYFDYDPAAELFLLVRGNGRDEARVAVGFAADYMKILEEQSGLNAMLKALRSLPTIRDVQIHGDADLSSLMDDSQIRVDFVAATQEVHSTISLGDGSLEIQQEATHYFAHIQQLWREFFIFSLAIATIGALFTWMLNRLHQRHVATIRAAERTLAKQHEDATIGRAAATISHEIKNPLNAISMGLQRLQIESPQLPKDQADLISSMLKAVERTNGIISELKQYAHLPVPNKRPVNVEDIISDLLTLYRRTLEEQSIQCHFNCTNIFTVDADPDMLSQALENLLKNAIEAQPGSGFIDIQLSQQHHFATVVVENGGLETDPQQIHTLLDPYVTSKATGTGLGLPIVRRIVEAHKGTLSLTSPNPNTLRVTMNLPLNDHT